MRLHRAPRRGSRTVIARAPRGLEIREAQEIDPIGLLAHLLCGQRIADLVLDGAAPDDYSQVRSPGPRGAEIRLEVFTLRAPDEKTAFVPRNLAGSLRGVPGGPRERTRTRPRIAAR